MGEAQAASDGGSPGQAAPAAKGEQGGDDGEEKSARFARQEDFENLNAKIDMLSESFTEIRGSLAQQRTAAVQDEEEIDDDTPLTASKVAKIVKRQTAEAANAQAARSERLEWDRKAATDFPLTDPKFQVEFKRQWRELTSSGLNPNSPRALYQAAKSTAAVMGVRKGSNDAVRPKTRTDEEDSPVDSEAPTGQRSTSGGGRRRSTIADNDPRVSFYNMKGNKTDKQLATFKEKLAAKDAERKGSK